MTVSENPNNTKESKPNCEVDNVPNHSKVQSMNESQLLVQKTLYKDNQKFNKYK